ncbi:MAG: MATE family efflux transporter, partial [Calditrichaeota bacterium]
MILKEVRTTVLLSAPVVAAQLAQISLGFVDTVMAGNLGAVDLAAIAIGRSLYMPGYLMLLGILLAINPITAQFYGAQKTPEIRRAVQSGLWLSQALALSGMIAIRYVDGLMHVMDIPE